MSDSRPTEWRDNADAPDDVTSSWTTKDAREATYRARDVASGSLAVAETKEPASNNRSDTEASSIKITSNDVVIAVMGAAGCGKSTFINYFCGRAEVGHSLQSYTKFVQPYLCPSFPLPDGKRLFLVDTPGFGDSSRDDADALCHVASFLSSTYKDNILLTGLIYLHRISDRRTSRSVLKSLDMFKGLCGEDTMENIVIATTMWRLPDDKSAESREQWLSSQDLVFKQMLLKGARLLRQDRGIISATTIVKLLVSERRKIVLNIQSELVDHGRRLDETAAGQIMKAEILESRKRFEEELKELKRAEQEALGVNDFELVDNIALMTKKTEYLLRQEEDASNRIQRSHIDLMRRTQQRRRLESDYLRNLWEDQEKSQSSLTQRLSPAASLNPDIEKEQMELSNEYRITQVQYDENRLRGQRFLDSLKYPDMDARLNGIVNNSSGTFKWVFESEPGVEKNVLVLREWFKTNDPILFISGKPGSGKTALMKFLFRHRSTQRILQIWSAGHPVILVFHAFWCAGTEAQKNFKGFLASILHQILSQRPELLEVCAQRDFTGTKSDFNDWSSLELRGLLISCLDSSSAPLCLFVDGIDEIEQSKDVNQLFGLLDCLRSLNARLKMCLSARPYEHILDYLNVAPRLRLQDLTAKDIEVYIRGTLQAKCSTMIQSDGVREKIEDITRGMVFKAEGVFLWASVALTHILPGTRIVDDLDDVLRRIEETPSPVEELFDHILAQIPRSKFQPDEARLLQAGLTEQSSFEAFWGQHNVSRTTKDQLTSIPDSGYASWGPAKETMHLDQKPSESQHASESNQFDTLDTKTIYSDNVSIDTTKRGDFVHRFAEMLHKDLDQQISDDQAEIAFSDNIEELLADFATRVGQDDSSLELRQAMIFIHKYRSSVSRTFLEMTQKVRDEDSEEEEDSIPDKPPLDEIMQMWHEREHHMGGEIPMTEDLADIESPPEELPDPFESDLQDYERLIVTTSAYKWLIACLRNISLLRTARDDSINQIRTEICKHVARPIHLSRWTPSMLSEGHFEMEVNSEIMDEVTDSRTLDSILTVTGSEQEAQAMTCSQYIQQTWPSNGMSLWQLTKDALLNPGEVVSTQEVDYTRMSARFWSYKLSVSISGVRGVLVEAAEQLCWTSGAINSGFSTFDEGILLCLPSLKRTIPTTSDHTYAPRSETDRGQKYQFDVHHFPVQHVSRSPSHDSHIHPKGHFESTQNRVSRSSLQRKSSNHIESMNGCINCRSKHLKCDRKRPSCNHCERTRLTCRWTSDIDNSLAMQLSQLELWGKRTFDSKNAQAVVHFKVGIEYKKPDATSQPGMCWQSLFKRCVIIHGFPIRRRSQPELGLELSLDVMVELIGTKRLHHFQERLFFKQFAIMLTPSARYGDLLIWHLCRSRDGDRISYLDHGMQDVCRLDYNELLKVRHIVGWCSNIKHLAGHVAGCYSVESSFLEPSPPSGSLYNCPLSFGRPVSGGSNVYFSSNHETVSLSRRNYLDMFRFLERRSTLFWDTGTSRGWLINGLRALLHILRQSFKIDENDDSGGMFVLKAGDLREPNEPFGARAARVFLNSPRNMSAKVSISTVRGTEYIYETLSERFERIYDVLEQAFDYQSKPRNWYQIPRSHLEGWDFISLARRDDTISPSMVSLPSVGKGWVDFIRATRAITLIGDGFGDLLLPESAMCNSVPCDRFCLAVSVTDLSDLVRSQRCKLTMKPGLICRTPSIIWHSPSGSSKQCACVVMEESSSNATHQQCVQVMWPAGQKALLPAEDESFTLEGRSNGAVIFGHDDSLQYHIPDLGQIPQPGFPPKATEELDVVDSGIGSSIDSASSGIEKVSTRSTLSPLDDSQSTVALSNSQCNSYGNSFMSGGYGVYGNVTGNFSVNQYFGSTPGQDTTWSSVPPKPLPSQDLGTTSAEVGGGETRTSLPEREIPTPIPEQEEQDSTDTEVQEGMTEMRALGLEEYCHVFRC